MAAAFVALTASVTKAQVKDVSFTLSPTAEYQWWNRNINLKNNMFYGARAGFGFGQHFEINAVFEKSVGLKGKMKSVTDHLPSQFVNNLPGAKVDVTRFGGESRINLLRNMGFTPFVTLGAGIQYFHYDPFDVEGADRYKEQQVYLSWGGGISANLSRRVNLSVAAKDWVFGMDESNKFLNPFAHDKTKRRHNWAALASLNVYLGGTNPDVKNGMNPRLRDALNSGFVNGIKFVAEPGLAYISFKDNDQLDDQWFWGGSLGMDFSSLIGVRAFYYQATKKPSKLDLKFNSDMSMYGLNFIARLNQPRGIVPYLNFGAGYLQTRKGLFKDLHPDNFQKTHLFGLFGGGVEIPLSKYFALYGSTNAMLMSDKVNPEDVMKPSQVKVNMMYRAGIRINIGSPVKSLEKQYSMAIQEERDRQNAEINRLRAQYQTEMDKLNAQLEIARLKNDTLTMRALQAEKIRVAEQKQRDEEVAKKVAEARVMAINEKAKEADSLGVKKVKTLEVANETMTAKEFEELVNSVVKKVKAQLDASSPKLSNEDMKLVLMALGKDEQPKTAQAAPATRSVNEVDDATKASIAELKKMLDQMNVNVNELKKEVNRRSAVAPATTLVRPVGETTPSVQYVPSAGLQPAPVAAMQDGKAESGSFLRMNRLGVYTGLNLGGIASWNIGIRGYLQVSNTRLDFVPEAYFGIGSKIAYGFSGNVVYNFNTRTKTFISPYVGLGLGLFKQDKAKFGTNVIIGSSINTLGGKLFVDYSIRRLFKYNQLAIGYRFVF